MENLPRSTAMRVALAFLWLGVLDAAAAAPRIEHDDVRKLVTMADGQGSLLLRLRYDGRCILDRVAVRGEEVVCTTTGVCSAMRVGSAEYTTRSGIGSPKIGVVQNTITASAIRFGGSGVEVDETWSFTLHSDRITWRITRNYLSGGTLDDSSIPCWDFANMSTWTGGLLGTGGVAWFRLFDTPVATYGVHSGSVTFWNKDRRGCLRILPAVPQGCHCAMRFSRSPSGVLSFSQSVTPEELRTKHGLARFLRDKQDVWAPVRVAPGVVAVGYDLWGLDYEREYDRGTIKHFEGRAIREICNTIARLGAVDARIHGSNGWYSGYAVLHEHWIAQLGLAIDDPSYVRSYAETLDDQRDRAIGADGRVKSRWAYGPWDAMPGTYDSAGFYECQWGWLMDSQPSFVTNVAELFDFNGDVEWVRRHKPTCERALDYLLRRDSDGDGLVEMMTDSHAAGRGSDWIDVVWAAHENALVNAEMYNALSLWADVEEVLGDSAKATQYRAAAQKLKTGFNKSTAEGGFWDAQNQWFVYWRDKDDSIHGDNLVTPANFMAVAYGICEDRSRRDTLLRHVENQMQNEKLFFWPLCFYAYQQGEAHPSQYPFPTYENGDIFLGWGELAIRAYARYDPVVAVRCIKNVLDRYAQDGLAFQRYLRRSQAGAGGDILSNMASPVVGLYRNIYGIQPKWNRLYLEPHLTRELAGTRLRYWLRDQWYTLDLSPERYRIEVNGFSVNETRPFGIHVKGDSLEYFCGQRKTPSMKVTRPAAAPLDLSVEAWSPAGAAIHRWTTSCARKGTPVTHALYDLPPSTEYKVHRNGAQAEVVRSDAVGRVVVECKASDEGPQTFELRP